MGSLHNNAPNVTRKHFKAKMHTSYCSTDRRKSGTGK